MENKAQGDILSTSEIQPLRRFQHGHRSINIPSPFPHHPQQSDRRGPKRKLPLPPPHRPKPPHLRRIKPSDAPKRPQRQIIQVPIVDIIRGIQADESGIDILRRVDVRQERMGSRRRGTAEHDQRG